MASSNLLKGFGVGVDVAGQIATDVALRRKSTNTVSTKAINGLSNTIEGVNGQISTIQGTLANLQGEVVSTALTGPSTVVPHTLGRIPGGAIVIQSNVRDAFTCSDATDTDVTIEGPAANVVIWIV